MFNIQHLTFDIGATHPVRRANET